MGRFYGPAVQPRSGGSASSAPAIRIHEVTGSGRESRSIPPQVRGRAPTVGPSPPASRSRCRGVVGSRQDRGSGCGRPGPTAEGPRDRGTGGRDEPHAPRGAARFVSRPDHRSETQPLGPQYGRKAAGRGRNPASAPVTWRREKARRVTGTPRTIGMRYFIKRRTTLSNPGGRPSANGSIPVRREPPTRAAYRSSPLRPMLRWSNRSEDQHHSTTAPPSGSKA